MSGKFDKEHVDQANKIVGNWNKYFAGGDGSDYSERYKHRMLPRDMWVLKQELMSLVRNKFRVSLPSNKPLPSDIKRLKESSGKITILDYGCGDGRCFEFIEKVAPFYKSVGIEIELVAYDPAIEGLKGFESHLLGKQFNKTDGPGLHDVAASDANAGRRGYHASTVQKDNVTVKFIHGDASDDIDHIQSLIGDVDMTMCMFGVLSYIPGQENRRDILRMFNDITNPDGGVVTTVPSTTRFIAEQEKYDKLRKAGNPYGEAKEPDDVYYEREGGKIKSFYHLYNSHGLYSDHVAVGLQTQGVQVDYISDMKFLLENPVSAKIDEFFSWMTPSCAADYTAADFIVVSNPSRVKSLEPGGYHQERVISSASDLLSKL